MSTLKVNTIRHTGASSDAIELNSDGSCTAKITNNLSNRNLIINGAMNVAQRGTSSTTDGMSTVDRFATSNSGLDEATTQSQHALTSSDTGPWAAGFRNSFHIQNGNQTGGAGADDRVSLYYKPEAQDLANSGWDYTSASSYITLSFWVKSSVAQNFYFFFRTDDGSQYNYVMETGSLSANTWTKVTKTIPGNSNLTINDDNGVGALLEFTLFRGTNKTGTRALNTWEAYNSSIRVPDMTSTWYTTNDATFEFTGVQLEVGDVATDFEHRSYGDELRRCQRYYQEIHGGYGGGASSSEIVYCTTYPVKMRATPSVSQTAAMTFEEPADADRNQSSTSAGIRSSRCSDTGCVVTLGNYSDIAKDQLYFSSCNQNSGGKVTYSAEL